MRKASNPPNHENGWIQAKIRVSRQAETESFPVSWSDWDFVKGRIGACKVSLGWWDMAITFFGGLAVASGIAIVAEQAWGYVALLGMAVVGGIVSFLARRALGTIQHGKIGDVLRDMQQIERRYERPNMQPASLSEKGSNGQ